MSDHQEATTYSIACGDVMPGCQATFESDSKDQLIGEIAAHARDEHGIDEITPEVGAAVEGAIQQR